MNRINRRKFLAELNKLLSFMYEEDRSTALGLYEKMFDAADDEQELIETLMSPTRQAVILARSYNAKERKLALSGRNSEARLPDFIETIYDVCEEFFGRDAQDLFSVPSSVVHPEEPAFRTPQSVRDGGNSEQSGWNFPEESDSPPAADKDVFVMDVPDSPTAPPENFFEDSSTLPSPELMPDAEPQKKNVFPDETAPGSSAPDLLPADKVTPQEDVPAAIVSSLQQIDREDEALPSPLPEDISSVEIPEIPSASPADTRYVPGSFNTGPEAVSGSVREIPVTSVYSVPVPSAPNVQATASGKSRIGLLILFLIPAIPITAVLVALLLVSALVCLTVSAAFVIAGIKVIASSFCSLYDVFANVMFVLGMGLVLIAAGILFFWLFLWIIGSVIVSLINGVINMGSRIRCSGGHI